MFIHFKSITILNIHQNSHISRIEIDIYLDYIQNILYHSSPKITL